MVELTQELLKELLHYDPYTGVFTWLVRRGKAQKGQIAGCMEISGYHIIRLYGKNYKAHRLAWIYVNGVWPLEHIDHKNRIRNDNRLCNLREATQVQNGCNSDVAHLKTNNLPRGVVNGNREGHYRSFIRVNGKQKYLGCYFDVKLAQQAYEEAAIKYHGEFKKV